MEMLIEHVADCQPTSQDQANVVELLDLQLSLVGGGIGDAQV